MTFFRTQLREIMNRLSGRLTLTRSADNCEDVGREKQRKDKSGEEKSRESVARRPAARPSLQPSTVEPEEEISRQCCHGERRVSEIIALTERGIRKFRCEEKTLLFTETEL